MALVCGFGASVEYVPVDGEVVRKSRCWIAVAPEIVGVCRSDLKELHRERYGHSTFGHEIVGRVVAVHSAGPHRVGERVVHNPNYALKRSSGFAELFWCGAAESDNLAAAFRAVPPGADARVMVFAEPLSAALRCAGKVGALVRSGAAIGVFAAGMFGTLIALALRAAGYRVVIVNRSRAKLDFLVERGLFAASELSDADRETGPFDASVIASSLLDERQLRLAARSTREGGVVQLFAGTAPGVLLTSNGVDLDRIRRDELVQPSVIDGRPIVLSGSHGADTENIDQAIRLLDEPVWASGVARLIGKTISFAEAGSFILTALAEDRPGKFLIAMPEARWQTPTSAA